jgi:hypothetical protein
MGRCWTSLAFALPRLSRTLNQLFMFEVTVLCPVIGM